jgi:hypothetical protein
MLSGELSSSFSAGCLSICLIWWIFNIGVHPPGMSFADKAGGTGDFSTIQMQPHHHVERVTRIL